MNPLIASLLKRNALAALVLTLLLTGLRLVPRAYVPPWQFFPATLFFGLLWANGTLIKRGYPISAVLLSLLLVPILGYPAVIFSNPLSRPFIEWGYRTRGFQMVHGCNGGAANAAHGDIQTIDQYL